MNARTLLTCGLFWVALAAVAFVAVGFIDADMVFAGTEVGNG